jgi:hypothetical protein
MVVVVTFYKIKSQQSVSFDLILDVNKSNYKNNLNKNIAMKIFSFNIRLL